MSKSGPPGVNPYRRKERFWLITILLLVIIFGSIGGWFFEFQSDLSLLNNILLFGLINFNVILLLLLAYLVLRNIVKLVFERKRHILGHKLRTRLVIAFIGLCLIPTLPLFWIATQFISFNLDYWFSHQVEKSLEQSVELGKFYLREEKHALAFDARLVKRDMLQFMAVMGPGKQGGEEFYASLLAQYQLDGIYVTEPTGGLLWKVDRNQFSPFNLEVLCETIARTGKGTLIVQNLNFDNHQEVLAAITPLYLSDDSTETIAAKLVAVRLLPVVITERLTAIANGYEDYLQLKLLQSPLKTSNLITFSIVTMLVMFAAIWFGFFLAKNMTVPIQSLVSATQAVAEGNLDVHLSSERQDELGMLINSFNKMVDDLRESREQVASAYLALQKNHAELAEQKIYMETVLKNIAAGVVSLDVEGTIVTINRSAEFIFGVSAEQVRGQPYTDYLQSEHMNIVDSFRDTYRQNHQSYLEQQVKMTMNNGQRTLLVNSSVLRDEDNLDIGLVVVVDDLTDLEKAQRMAAWREVARRIAHEIKNPLTPIQLSAQRLRRKYSHLIDDHESIFDECTRTIVQQVEQMKHLVNEFSKFARLPQVQLKPSNLPTIVEESIAIYRHTYPEISFTVNIQGEIPTLLLDPGQFKQVMVNLLDNAIHAVQGRSGEIEIRLFYDPVFKIARLDCLDNGHGISPQDKLRMFDPHYSTKEQGAGLGLTIVASIVADHSGFIKVRDNEPQGTIISIELPG